MPTEAALDAAGAQAIFADWPERRRRAALAADLADLDISLPAAEAPPLPDDAAAISGALYVIEGSRLGGRFLARQVGEGLPKRYLDPAVRPPGWPALLEQFEPFLYDSMTFATATAAALAVFERFEAAGRRWLREA